MKREYMHDFHEMQRRPITQSPEQSGTQETGMTSGTRTQAAHTLRGTPEAPTCLANNPLVFFSFGGEKPLTALTPTILEFTADTWVCWQQ